MQGRWERRSLDDCRGKGSWHQSASYQGRIQTHGLHWKGPAGSWSHWLAGIRLCRSQRCSGRCISGYHPRTITVCWLRVTHSSDRSPASSSRVLGQVGSEDTDQNKGIFSVILQQQTMALTDLSYVSKVDINNFFRPGVQVDSLAKKVRFLIEHVIRINTYVNF